jgi:hypothetical protein
MTCQVQTLFFTAKPNVCEYRRILLKVRPKTNLLANITLSISGGFSVTNTLAYFVGESVTKKTTFYRTDTWMNMIVE